MANRVRVTYILAVRETGARRRYDQDSFKNHPMRKKSSSFCFTFTSLKSCISTVAHCNDNPIKDNSTFPILRASDLLPDC